MTHEYECILWIMNGLGVMLYAVAHYWRMLRQTGKRQIMVTACWGIQGLFLAGIFLWGLLTSQQDELHQVDGDFVGTIIVLAGTGLIVVAVARELEALARVLRHRNGRAAEI